jgi:hypothetical protein
VYHSAAHASLQARSITERCARPARLARRALCGLQLAHNFDSGHTHPEDGQTWKDGLSGYNDAESFGEHSAAEICPFVQTLYADGCLQPVTFTILPSIARLRRVLTISARSIRLVWVLGKRPVHVLRSLLRASDCPRRLESSPIVHRTHAHPGSRERGGAVRVGCISRGARDCQTRRPPHRRRVRDGR